MKGCTFGTSGFVMTNIQLDALAAVGLLTERWWGQPFTWPHMGAIFKIYHFHSPMLRVGERHNADWNRSK